MPEPTTAVVEVPPEVKERQEVDAYIEKRKEEKSAPPPEVKVETTTPEPPPETAEAVKEAVEDATDDYIRRRNYESKQKRKPRGGVQAKIDELTKKTAELEAKVAEPPKVETPTVVPPVVEAPKPAETAKEAPKMADYTDIDKYNTDLALWAAAQTKVVPPTEAPKTTPAEPPKPDPQAALRKEEFDKFLEAGKKLIVRFPDFNETLNAAHIRGLTMSEQARIAITKLAAPEVAYWLAKPENDLAARNFMKLDDFQQVIEVGKIAERLTVRPSDFVSNAPPPGPRLNGTTRSDVPLNEITDTDEYIRQRRQAKRAGIRR